MNPLKFKGYWLLAAACVVLTPLACKDKEPCDDDQDSIGTGCYAKASAGSAGSGSASEAGAPASEGGAPAAAGAPAEGGWPGGIEPPGNPDAMFGSACETNKNCGGPAPICLIPPGPEYCSIIDCQPGEANADMCPEGWVCFKLNAETRSACLNPN